MELSRVIIFTPDVKRLSDFYMSCFELSVVGISDDGWTELNAGKCNIGFHHIPEYAEDRPPWVKVVFGAEDVAREKERLEKLGIKMSDVVEYGSIHLCDGRDPDGNPFQISSRGL